MCDKICCVYYESTEHLTPCNHLVCKSCFLRLNICPVCRPPLGSVEEDSDFESDDSCIDEANHTLFNAARTGNKRLVRQMLDQGANHFDWAMCETAADGYLNIVRLLLDHGASDYNEAILCAATNGHLNVVKLMIEKGADNFVVFHCQSYRLTNRDILTM